MEGLRFTEHHWFGILLEVQVLECEMCLHDAGGLHSGPQHVLLCGDVLALGYPLQVVQVAGGMGSTGVRALVSTAVTPKQPFTGAGQQITKVYSELITVLVTTVRVDAPLLYSRLS